MDADIERTLVRQAQSGDRSAFEKIVRAYARLVWATVYGLVRDPSWTEDLVQETFLRGWESLGTLKEPAAFRGWLLTIARRLAWRQGDLPGPSDPGPKIPETPASPEADPEEARERVQGALSRLPERYRIPVTLHFLNGMDYGAISELTGLANGSLRGLIARGAAKLRAELAPWWRTKNDPA